MRARLAVIAATIILAGGAIAGLYLYHPPTGQTMETMPAVAGENFWGSLLSQLGGTHLQVTSIVSDPNADPHEYETNSQNAQAFANAKIVVINGAGYDDWAVHLLAANSNGGQKVLNVADLLGKKAGDNPHFWYEPAYVNRTVHQMYADLVSVDSSNAGYYELQYSNLNASLHMYNSRINEIRQKFSGTKVASTESIFEYLANATGLDLISPPAFMNAVSEGIDPPASSRVEFEQQIVNASSPGNATVLVDNQQTITPLTEGIKGIAAQHGIPIVAVTETIQPPDVSFEEWMNVELISLQNALQESAH